MFTGVGKLKISLPECGFQWKRKSTLICVCVGVCVSICALTSTCSRYSLNGTNMHKLRIHYKYVMIPATVCLVGCVLLGDNWSLMVHLLLSERAAEKSYLKMPHINGTSPIVTNKQNWQVVESIFRTPTAREDAEFVRDSLNPIALLFFFFGRETTTISAPQSILSLYICLVTWCFPVRMRGPVVPSFLHERESV